MPIVYDDHSSDYTLEVLAEDAPSFEVSSFEGEEAISTPYRYSLKLASRQRDVDLGAVLGKPVKLLIHGIREDRFVHGIVSRLTQSNSGAHFARYEMEVVPAIWFLSFHEEHRIFQQQTVQEIVTSILDQYGIKGDPWVKWSLSGELPIREYCVCYGETLLDFICRLLAEEGVFFFFEHRAESHVMVFGDDVSVHEEMVGGTDIAFRSEVSRSHEIEHIHAFEYDLRVRPQATLLRDFDFKKPHDDIEGDCADTEDDDAVGHPAASKIVVYDYPGRFLETSDADRLVKIRHGQNRAERRTARGSSNCRRFLPGTKFALTEHERDDYNSEYLLTRLMHRGSQPSVTAPEAPGAEEVTYEAEFSCQPAADLAVWDSPPRKPQVRGVQTALVVGPKGEEIYTDDDGYGLVKVQFHWDRRGEYDENSSCWLRVAQPAAGSGMGMFALPRVGHEVLVEFLNGDPDRPLVTGALYNAESRPPLQLPDEKTRITLKSQTTPDSEGYNELRFEDKKDEEQIFIHGQKDLDLYLENDQRELIGNDTHLTVENDSLAEIKNDSHATIGRHRHDEIAKDDNLKIAGKQAIEVAESRSLTVSGDKIDVIKGKHSEECSGDVYVKGMNVVVEGAMCLTLKCGSNAVVIDSSGVTVKGSLVTLDGSMVNIASGPGSPAGSGSAGSAVAPAAPTAPEPAAEGVAAAVVAVRERPFKEPDPDEVEAEEKTWIEIELVGEDDVGIPGEKFKITTPDGKVVTGTTGPEGLAKVIGIDSGNCKVTFPNLDKEAWEPA
jgi:type VI secretion system secreted protein VgrG